VNTIDSMSAPVLLYIAAAVALYRLRKHKPPTRWTLEAFHLLSQILPFHPGAVAITDSDGVIQSASDHFVHWFCRSEDGGKAQGNVLEIVTPEDAYHYRNILRYVGTEQKTVRDFELNTAVPETERRVRLTVVPLCDSARTLVGLLHVFDPSATEQHLGRDMDHVEKLVNIGQLAATMAHELNTPLGSIMLSADMVRDARPSDKVMTEIQKIKQQAIRCSEVVRRLLSYVRPDDHERTDDELASIVKKVISLVEVEARKRDITLSLDIASSHGFVRCNENQMEQLFFNLYANALHAVERNGRIDVQIADDALLNQVVVTFADNGCGIPAEHLGRVFEPFFTTKSRTEGTGLGLALCRRIVLEHHGKIDVKSTVGQGTTFSLTFPAVK